MDEAMHLLFFSFTVVLFQPRHHDKGLDLADFVFLHWHLVQPGARPAPVHSILLLRFLTFLQAVRQALGGSSSIEDLLIPFFCISTNLSQLDQEVSFSGSSAAFAPSASRAGPRKRQIMACSARFDDRGRPYASHVQVSRPCG